jgi:hypothetical protein
MNIFAQLSGDKLLVISRASLPEEILPWDDDSTISIPISIYDVATGIDEPAGSIPRGFLYSNTILLKDGRLLILKTSCHTRTPIMRNYSIRKLSASRASGYLELAMSRALR